jgi:hypothetical protein
MAPPSMPPVFVPGTSSVPATPDYSTVPVQPPRGDDSRVTVVTSLPPSRFDVVEIPPGTPVIIRNNVPKDPNNSQCHDLPGNVVGLPPGGPNGRNVGDLRNGLISRGYHPVVIRPGDPLPPLFMVPNRSVYVVGGAHSGIVINGSGYDYTKPAPQMYVPPRVNPRNSLDDVRNARSPRAVGFGQPYQNEPITIMVPPGQTLPW